MNEIMDNRLKSIQQKKDQAKPQLKQSVEKHSGLLLRDESVRLNED